MKEILKFLKLMIVTGLSGGFAFIGFVFYRAYDEGRIWAPAPPPAPEDLAWAAFDARLWMLTKWSIVLLIICILVLLANRFLYVPAVNARERIPYDPATGLAPVVRRNVAPFWQRLVGHNEYDEFDPNLSTAPHRKVYSNGTMRVTSQTDGLDPHAQADYARGSWAVQNTVARKGRGASVGESRLLSGEAAAKAELARMKLEAARAKLGDKAKVVDEPVKALPLPVVSFREAIDMSTPTQWILGQGTEQQPANPATAGKLLAFDPRSSHMALIGATRTGKTSSTGLMIVALARRHGVHPIVFDGKGGLDWGPLDQVVEWHDLNDGNLAPYVEALVAVYQKRFILLRDAGKSHIYQLPAERRPAPILALFEEFGEHFTALEKAERAAAGQSMNTLFRLGQAAGITLCLIDQAPEKWTTQMRGNAKFVICYKLKGGAANAFNEYYADQLPDRGVFSQDNNFYKAWHTEAELPNLRGMFPPLPKRLLPVIDGVSAPVSVAVSDAKTATSRNGAAQVVETPETADKKGGDQGKNILIPPSLEKAFRRFGKWDDFCEGYFRFYPETTQAQLRRVMSSLDGRDPETFKTEAFRYYHRYSPNGDRSKTV